MHGINQYQPHAYHAGLVILAAFGKRPEFEALLVAVPREMRFSASSGRPLTYDAHSDTCSHPVCRKHAKAIAEMGRELRGENAQKPAAATSVTVEELPDEEEEEEEEEEGREGPSVSGKVHIRAADVEDDGPVTPKTGPASAPAETRAEKFSTLVLRPPSPPDLPEPASSPAVASSPQPVPAFDHLSPAFTGAGGEASRAAAAVCSTAVVDFREGGESAEERERGQQQQQQQWVSEQLQHSPPSFAHLQGMGRGALPAAVAMTSAKSVPAGGGGGSVRNSSRHAAPGRGGGRSSSSSSSAIAADGTSNSWHPASHGVDQPRVSPTAAYGLAAFGDGGDGVGKGASDRHGGAAWLGAATGTAAGAAAAVVAAQATAGSFVGSASSNGAEVAGFFGPNREQQQQQQQQQGNGVAMPPPGSLGHHASAMTLAIQQQQQQQQQAVQHQRQQQRQQQQRHLAAPLVVGSAAGTLTSRLWGVPALPPASGSGGGGGFRPTPHGNIYAPPRPWPWHTVGSDSAHAVPAARVALSNMPGSSGLEALRVVAARAPRLAAAGLPGGGGVGPAAAPQPPPPLPPSPQGKMAAATAAAAAAMAGRTSVMTAGEASAAAISRATLSGGSAASSSSPFNGGATGGGGGGRGRGAGAGGPGREIGVEEDGSRSGAEAGGAGGPNEEEMMDLWAMIGRGDSE